MIDTTALLSSINLHDLIERDAGETGKGKRIYCPFCQVSFTGGPALQVFGEKYHCFGCGAHGDAIDYMQKRDGVDFVEACRRLGWNGGEQDAQSVQRALIERQQRKIEQDRQRANRLDEVLAEFSHDEIWAAFNRRMTADHVAWWELQGIPKEWQDYLRLGYTPDKPYYDRTGQLRHSPAYTIPYFHTGFEFRNMQYRLQDPANPKDRYRFEGGLRTTYYVVEPSQPIQDNVIICEGAKKAIVCKVYGDTGDRVTVLGVPSKVDSGGVLDVVSECAHVWFVYDPDAFERPVNAGHDWKPTPIKLAEKLGHAARVVRLPFKSDDGFVQHGLEAEAWKSALRQARPYA